MATILDVRSAASSLAKSVMIPRSLKQPGKIYEAWLMLEIAATLKSMRLIASAKWEDGSGLTPRKAIFRGGPGPLWDPSKTKQPGFVKISCSNGGKFEIQNSVQFKGLSGAKHEVDISIERADVFDKLRENNKQYPDSIPIGLIELKYYNRAKFNIGIVRQFLAIQFDLSMSNPSQMGAPMFSYMDEKFSVNAGSSSRSSLSILTSAENVSSDTLLLANFYNSAILCGFDAVPGWVRRHKPHFIQQVKLRCLCKKLASVLK